MMRRIEIDGLRCLCSTTYSDGGIAYILYPMDFLDEWVEQAASRYGVTIVVITGMAWDDDMSPWPAKGVPKGCPDFKGKATEFLDALRSKVIPGVEQAMGFRKTPVRTLVGVSMSGLFTLWQWMLCDTFTNIASLSGSFWYDGFLEWMKARAIPSKQGNAFFLLGDKEASSKVGAFKSVAANTKEIVEMLSRSGIRTEYQGVPGNHYADPIPRLDKAFNSLFGP